MTKPLQRRKKCLVLQGPSRTGKTEFVRGLFPLGVVLQLNCANLRNICLDGFDCLRYRAILWDEASASLVSNSRKVCQHLLCTVELGRSPNGCACEALFPWQLLFSHHNEQMVRGFEEAPGRRSAVARGQYGCVQCGAAALVGNPVSRIAASMCSVHCRFVGRNWIFWFVAMLGTNKSVPLCLGMSSDEGLLRSLVSG